MSYRTIKAPALVASFSVEEVERLAKTLRSDAKYKIIADHVGSFSVTHAYPGKKASKKVAHNRSAKVSKKK